MNHSLLPARLPNTLLLPCLLALASCAAADNGTDTTAAITMAAASSAATTAVQNKPVIPPAAQSPASLPLLVVHKHESCGCCGVWVEHMREAGFPVEVNDVEDMEPVKSRLGIPYGMGSCHTAEVDGYFVEGHVPAEDVKRLLSERPAAKGLALPGMPIGSPGMEHPSGLRQPFTVSLITPEGKAEAFSEHNQPSNGRNE